MRFGIGSEIWKLQKLESLEVTEVGVWSLEFGVWSLEFGVWRSTEVWSLEKYRSLESAGRFRMSVKCRTISGQIRSVFVCYNVLKC